MAAFGIFQVEREREREKEREYERGEWRFKFLCFITLSRINSAFCNYLIHKLKQ